MRYKTRLNFMLKLVLSIIALSILGLIVTFFIVNTTVRDIIHDNVIGVAHKDARYISREIDAWFDAGNHIVSNLARIWSALGVDYIKPIADSLLDEYDFLREVYAGFADGSFLGSGNWVLDGDWDSTTRPWYKDALASPGQLITTIPYRSPIENFGTVTTVAKWVPDLGGMEAVVAVSITMDYIIDMINQYRLAAGGYLILLGPRGEIISHPNIEYTIGPEGLTYLSDIPNGELLMNNIISGEGVGEFGDHMLGPSYFMTFPLEAQGWTLAAVVPTSAITGPVSQYLWVIMLTFATVVVALFILTMFFISLLTKDMEESRVTEEKLRIIIDNMPLVSNFRDKNFNILECNEAAAKLFDLSSKEEYLDRFFDLSPEFQPDGRLSSEKAQEQISETFKTGYTRFEWMHQKLDGSPIPVEVTLTRVDWRGEENLIAFVRDLRDFYKYKETERIARQRLKAMLDSSPLACSIIDEELNILEANHEAVALFGVTDGQEYIDKFMELSPKYQPDGRLSSEKMLEKLKSCFETGNAHFEWMHQTLDSKRQIPCEVNLKYVILDGKNLAIAFARDLREINNAVSMVKQLEKVAFTDALTGTRNRRYFMDAAEKELGACIEKSLPYSLIMIDIDYFKKINDTYGHPVGDEVLKIVVARLYNSLKRDTLVARYGGEEFVVVLPEVSHENVFKTAQRIRNSIEASAFMIGYLEIRVTISLGVASKTAQSTTLSEIINNADNALYQAKEAGRNMVVYYDRN